jgi:hypothetical protein
MAGGLGAERWGSALHCHSEAVIRISGYTFHRTSLTSQPFETLEELSDVGAFVVLSQRQQQIK